MLHKDGQLLALMAKHVDDLKVTGVHSAVQWILKQIQDVFGQMKLEWNTFTNCGVRHSQDKTTKEVDLDQEEYIKGIRLCVHPDITGKPADSLAEPSLHEQYWSVLGAIAYAVLTRPDIAVFVSALQRSDDLPSQFRRLRRLASGQASMICADLKRKIDMATGTVKFFNSTKGFGFIEQDGGQPDVFVHISAVERAGMSTLAEGQKLSFEVVKDNRNGKSAAENLQAA